MLDCLFSTLQLAPGQHFVMDSPPATTAGTTRNTLHENSTDEDTLLLPRSELDSLSELQVHQVQTDLSTELFGFAPTAFTARVVDVANEVIYDVIDKIEIECMQRWVGAEQTASTDESRKQAVQKVGGAFDVNW